MANRSKANSITLKFQPRQLLLMLALVLILYVVVPQLGEVQDGMSRLAHANPAWTIAAGLIYLTASLFSVGVYRLITPRRLPIGRTAIVQYAGSFANRLLPAGIGALGVDYFYLRKQKYTQPVALAALLLNNLLGAIGHILLLAVILIVAPATFDLSNVNLQLESNTGIVILLGVLSLAAVVVVARRLRHKLIDTVNSTLKQLRSYKRKLGRVGGALVFSLGITMAHVMCLWASGQALGLTVTVGQAVVVLAAGVLLGAIIPSPGGLGGAEAGIVASLAAFGMPGGDAVAVAILYRLASYWLGFAVGAVAFVFITKRAYI